MVSSATGNVKPAEEALTETPFGFEFCLEQNVPATDLDVLFDVTQPRQFRTLDDVSGDGIADHQLVSVLIPVDTNNNGVLERGIDRALITTVEARAIQPGVQVACCAVVRRRAAQRVYGMVSGAGRVFPTSLLEPRRPMF